MWSGGNERELEFLECFQREPVLWNSKDTKHKDKQYVHDAWMRISEHMGIPVVDLKRKRDSLMATYRGHKRKIVASTLSGAGAETVYKPIWFAFDLMDSFLNDIVQCRKTMNTDAPVNYVDNVLGYRFAYCSSGKSDSTCFLDYVDNALGYRFAYCSSGKSDSTCLLGERRAYDLAEIIQRIFHGTVPIVDCRTIKPNSIKKVFVADYVDNALGYRFAYCSSGKSDSACFLDYVDNALGYRFAYCSSGKSDSACFLGERLAYDLAEVTPYSTGFFFAASTTDIPQAINESETGPLNVGIQQQPPPPILEEHPLDLPALTTPQPQPGPLHYRTFEKLTTSFAYASPQEILAIPTVEQRNQTRKNYRRGENCCFTPYKIELEEREQLKRTKKCSNPNDPKLKKNSKKQKTHKAPSGVENTDEDTMCLYYFDVNHTYLKVFGRLGGKPPKLLGRWAHTACAERELKRTKKCSNPNDPKLKKKSKKQKTHKAPSGVENTDEDTTCLYYFDVNHTYLNLRKKMVTRRATAEARYEEINDRYLAVLKYQKTTEIRYRDWNSKLLLTLKELKEYKILSEHLKKEQVDNELEVTLFVSRENMAKEREAWTKTIDLIRELSYLWDKKHKEYFNRDMRREAFKMLLQLFNEETGKNTTLADFKKKLENMRTTYGRELKKNLCKDYRDSPLIANIYSYKRAIFSYGNTVKVQVYAGKNYDNVNTTPTNVVLALCGDYLNKGHTVCTDNWYTSLELARKLIAGQTYFLGTLSKNRRGLPQTVVKAKLKVDEFSAQENGEGITVMKWKVKRDVLLLSIKHSVSFRRFDATEKIVPNSEECMRETRPIE
ncbi:unnamed protein product [Leptidea sinapis]|uniref:MADF domain-containing protein n=1 Tax=Leptidea sinapis TaxID=189913 RepID=A0A5E4PLW1_9NEOP|nr:unnamed protein product [Leptidea sinapis]